MLFAHHISLFNGGVYFDGCAKGMLYSDKGLLFDVFDRLGLPINYFVYVFADQIATFLWVLTGLGFYPIL